jgi:hypothetical protein
LDSFLETTLESSSALGFETIVDFVGGVFSGVTGVSAFIAQDEAKKKS